MRTIEVAITNYYEVDLDDSKFTPEFMEKFSQDFHPFEDIEDHAGYLAQIADDNGGFIALSVQGYGRLEDMGIDVMQVGSELEILND